jgi:hypothetical protein
VIGRAGIPLAARRNSLYLNPMVRSISTSQAMIAASQPRGRVASAIVWGAASLGVVVLIGAAALWFHYGTAVFFEMIAAGISACF